MFQDLFQAIIELLASNCARKMFDYVDSLFNGDGEDDPESKEHIIKK